MTLLKNIIHSKVPEDWGMYMQDLEKKPAITRVNLALYNNAPYNGYHHRIQLSVCCKETTESGLPSQEENTTLWKIEDAFIELLKQVDAIDAGLVKGNNRLNFIFYVKKAGDVGNKLIGKLKKLFPDYEFKLAENEDKAWGTYFGTLYPDKYAMQEIQNNKVLQTLQEHHDNSNKSRPIDHYIFFKNEDSAQNFITVVEKEGFKKTSQRYEKTEEYPVMISVSREDVPNNIHHVTSYLLDTAEAAGGDYDGWESPVATD